ncbi:MAG: beta-propeller domain-containing protein [Nanoarchaeota archaeon]|nr:beta-propeller domain-containing protein [Nanoarchaeota archaeon]
MRKIILVALLTVVILISGCVATDSEVKKFSSYTELESHVKESGSSGYGLYSSMGGAERTMQGTIASAESSSKSDTTPSASTYSTTNIQVEGVDEADIVKNDGKYIYTVSNGIVYIVDAYPAENAKLLSNITSGGTIQNIFINKDRLVLFGQDPHVYLEQPVGIRMPYYNIQTSFIQVYDVSDRSNPTLVRNLSIDGNYYDSRMIGDYVYVILNQNFYYQEGGPIPLPRIMSSSGIETTLATDVYYFDGTQSNTFTTIAAVNIQTDEEINKKVYLMDYSQNIYVSQDNIYITYQKTVNENMYNEKRIDIIITSMPIQIAQRMRSVMNSINETYEKMNEIGQIYYEYSNTLSNGERAKLEKDMQDTLSAYEIEIQKERYKTIIQKIAVSNGNIEYKTSGEVPGMPLNQFSMDENEGYFRIATTIPRSWNSVGSESMNNLYILGNTLTITGKLEDLAPGERIYSARFVGNRCYLVTFKQVDPLFVIDTDPFNPRVLGELKIPGYSDYLHPYDENHIIGIGKEATDQGTFAWYQGVKLALFDVTDVANPVEVSTYAIGDRGTSSDALYDHKAFLFDKEKNLLVIPINLAEVNQSQYPDGVPTWAHGETVWQGAYVFDLSVANGFVLKGKVNHSDIVNDYWYYGSYAVKRSLYMDDILYTISDKMIKMNSLSDISEINKVNIPYVERYYGYGGGIAEGSVGTAVLVK